MTQPKRDRNHPSIQRRSSVGAQSYLCHLTMYKRCSKLETRLFYYFEPFLTAFDHLQKGLQTLVEPGFLAYEKLNSQGNLSGALKPEQIT